MILFYRAVRILTKLFVIAHRWADHGVDRCRRNKLRRRFPKGCKITGSKNCKCGTPHVGKIGVVGEMVSEYDEFHVDFENGRGDILCPRGMERA